MRFKTKFRFLDESPRWLVQQGRIEEAKQILKKAAIMNNVSIPEAFDKEFGKDAEIHIQVTILHILL